MNIYRRYSVLQTSGLPLLLDSNKERDFFDSAKLTWLETSFMVSNFAVFPLNLRRLPSQRCISFHLLLRSFLTSSIRHLLAPGRTKYSFNRYQQFNAYTSLKNFNIPPDCLRFLKGRCVQTRGTQAGKEILNGTSQGLCGLKWHGVEVTRKTIPLWV